MVTVTRQLGPHVGLDNTAAERVENEVRELQNDRLGVHRRAIGPIQQVTHTHARLPTQLRLGQGNEAEGMESIESDVQVVVAQRQDMFHQVFVQPLVRSQLLLELFRRSTSLCPVPHLHGLALDRGRHENHTALWVRFQFLEQIAQE